MTIISEHDQTATPLRPQEFLHRRANPLSYNPEHFEEEKIRTDADTIMSRVYNKANEENEAITSN